MTIAGMVGEAGPEGMSGERKAGERGKGINSNIA